jgi:LmbE family N-acetylglucosaminyl deacetylase
LWDDGSDLRQELAQLLRDVAPTLVAFPDPLDRHPDHATTGLFTMLALGDWLPRAQTPGPNVPRLLAYLVHWPG